MPDEKVPTLLEKVQTLRDDLTELHKSGALVVSTHKDMVADMLDLVNVIAVQAGEKPAAAQPTTTPTPSPSTSTSIFTKATK